LPGAVAQPHAFDRDRLNNTAIAQKFIQARLWPRSGEDIAASRGIAKSRHRSLKRFRFDSKHVKAALVRLRAEFFLVMTSCDRRVAPLLDLRLQSVTQASFK